MAATTSSSSPAADAGGSYGATTHASMDVEDEGGLMLVAEECAKPNYSILFFTVVEALLFGIPLGCIAFRNVLVANGAFSIWCEGGDTECHAQEVAIAQSTQFIVIISAVGNLTIEPLMRCFGGPNGTARFLVAALGVGLAVCGIDLRSGAFYVVGMSAASVATAALFNLNIGTFFGAATTDAEPEAVNFWMTNLCVSVDLGYLLAGAAAAIAGWTVLPLAWWFVILGVGIAAGLSVWFEASVKLRGVSPASNDALDAAPPRPFASLLTDRGFLVATAQFAWSLIFFSSIQAAAARIARFFALSADASFYTPVAVCGGGVLILLWSHTRWHDDARVSGVLRIALAGVVALLFGVPAFRSPAAYFVGFAIGGAWRSTSMAVSIHNVYLVGAGGTETRAYSLMAVLSTVIALVVGQPVTHWVGSSPLALSIVMVFVPAGAYVCETLTPRPTS